MLHHVKLHTSKCLFTTVFNVALLSILKATAKSWYGSDKGLIYLLTTCEAYLGTGWNCNKIKKSDMFWQSHTVLIFFMLALKLIFKFYVYILK